MSDGATTVISMPLLRLIARLAGLARRLGFDGDALTGWLTTHGEPHHLDATFVRARVPGEGLTVLAPRADGWSLPVLAALAPRAERLFRVAEAVPANGALVGRSFTRHASEPVVWVDAAWGPAEIDTALAAWGTDAAVRAALAARFEALPIGDGDALRIVGAGRDARIEVRRALRIVGDDAAALVDLADGLGVDGQQVGFLRDGFEALFPPGVEHRASVGLVIAGDRLLPELMIDLEGLTGAWAGALLAGFGCGHEVDATIAALEAAVGNTPDETGAYPIDAVTLAFDDAPASPNVTLGWFAVTGA